MVGFVCLINVINANDRSDDSERLIVRVVASPLVV